jgi:anti-sigma factor RsiW
VRRRQPRCDSIVELVTDYLEGVLRPAARRRFQRHLERCPGCAAYLAQMLATIGLTTRLRGAPNL